MMPAEERDALRQTMKDGSIGWSTTPSPRRDPLDRGERARRRLRAAAGRATARMRAGPPAAPRARDALSRRDHRRFARSDAGRPEAILLGQDIAEYGGVFKATEGFVEEFGKARVRNTPIIESGAIGAALGLALEGFRPMVEMQFGDFITCGFNQIVNNLAKTHYRWGAGVPVVLRAPIGGGVGRRPVPLAERRGVVHARRRPEGRGAGDARRRQGIAAGRVRGRQPGAVSRAQVPVPIVEGRRAATAITPCRSARRAWRGGA